MAKNSSARLAANARYIAKQDELKIRIPSGCKEKIEEYAALHGESVNGLVNRLLRDVLGLSVEEWKQAGK